MTWKAVLGYLPGSGVQALVAFGSIVAFTRLLSPEEYGQYALVLSAVGIIHLLFFTWIEAALARFFAVETQATGQAALFATIYRTFFAVALLVGAGVAAALALAPLSAGVKFTAGIGFLWILARSLVRLAQERMRLTGEVRRYAAIDMAQTGGGFVLALIFALAGAGASAPFAGAALATAACVAWVSGAEIARAHGGRFDPARARTYARYGMLNAFALVLSMVLASTDRFVLAAYAGDAAVAAYHAGYVLSNRTLDLIFVWLAMAGGPAMVVALERGGVPALQTTARDQATLILLIIVPAAVGLALIATPLCMLLVGPGLSAQASGVAPWIAVSALMAGVCTHYLNCAFTLARRPEFQVAAFAVPVAAHLALCIALIPRFGIEGAAWATTAAYAIGLVTSFVLMRRCLALPIPWRALAGIALATAAMAMAIGILPAQRPLLDVAGKTLVGAAAYATVVLALDVAGARRVLRDAAALAATWLRARNPSREIP